ncbi:hypothetical protein ACQEV9_07495 [Streptomyces chartreusis]|uniref:hypothetical protein n=1 Tax=Streptomyces chartreusis TaxID=1969 RepID=UPI003D8A8617
MVTMAHPGDIVPPDFRSLAERGAQHGLLRIRVIGALRVHAAEYCAMHGRRTVRIHVAGALASMPEVWVRELNGIPVNEHQRLVEQFFRRTGPSTG